MLPLPLPVPPEGFRHAQVSEHPAQDLRPGGGVGGVTEALCREAVCCLQRQESHCLQPQLCPVKNPPSAHRPLLPFKPEEPRMKSHRTITPRGQILFGFFCKDSLQ